MNNQIKYEIACGSYKAMEMLKLHGVKGLNHKTHKNQIIDKNAQYKIRIDKILKADKEYQKEYDEKYIKFATLLCNKNLIQIAEKKGLILQ